MDTSASQIISNAASRFNLISEFCNEHHDVREIIDTGLLLADAMPKCLLMDEAGTEKVWLSLLWQQVSAYQSQAIELAISRDLDSAFALLRMASELARDINTMRGDPGLLALWMRRSQRGNEYRKKFKFDDTPPGRAAHQLYKLCCKFGIHGHTSSLSQSRVDPRSGNSSQLRPLVVSKSGVIYSISVWLGSFFPLHTLCLTATSGSNVRDSEVIASYYDFVQFLRPVIRDLNVKAKEMAETRAQV